MKSLAEIDESVRKWNAFGKSRYATRFRHGDAVHGLESQLWRCWSQLKARTKSMRLKDKVSYLDRHITVCTDWQNSYESFKAWALANGYEQGLTLDRIDGAKNYCPENCRWVTRKDQMHNRRDNVWIAAFGELKLTYDWVKDPRCAVARPSTLWKRIKLGWPAEIAIRTPLRQR
jgi:hypothetical protein